MVKYCEWKTSSVHREEPQKPNNSIGNS